MADIEINSTQIQSEVNVTNVAILSIGKTVEEMAAIVSENFSAMTKKVNLFGTNVAKRLERIAAANKEIAASFAQMGDGAGKGIGSAGKGVEDLLTSVGDGADKIGGGISSVGNGFAALGSGIGSAASGLASLGEGFASVVNSFAGFGEGLNAAAAGVATLVPSLPALGSAMLKMAQNLSGILDYLPSLALFIVVLTVLSLMGEGLSAAGGGLMNIGAGLTSMSEGMAALTVFFPVFLASLAGITENIGGIVTFVLLAAAMLVMAVAMEKMNEQLTDFVESMTKLTGSVSVGFVAAFAVFGATLIAMSFFLEKVATGMDKITKAAEKQAEKLSVLNPLLAAQAILTDPIVGAITVAAAVAGGLLVKSLLPAMATGGVVSRPTVAMIGEGSYPEAVVPLGDSPQFSSMKTDIANAVLQGIQAMQSGRGGSSEIVLNLDGERFARAILPKINGETRRNGYVLQTKGV